MEIKGGQHKYEIINYLKGFSIITIVLMHLIQSYPIPNIVYKLSGLGGTGVHIFFFCSGFGLFLSQCKKEVSYLEFLKNKLMKIYIPYVFIVIVIALFPFTFDGSINERFMALLSHVFMFKMFVPELVGSFSYPLWYMSTLFQFYFVFIVLYKIKKKSRTNIFIISCCLLSVVWWLFTAGTGLASERIWGSFFLQYLWEFVLGMCIADKLNRGETIKINMWILVFVTVVGLAIGGMFGSIGGVLKAFNDVFLAIGYGGVALLIYSYINPYKWICLKVNILSYEWYLTHATCFGLVKLMGGVDFISLLLKCVASIVLSIIVAILYHVLIVNILKKKQKVA